MINITPDYTSLRAKEHKLMFDGELLKDRIRFAPVAHVQVANVVIDALIAQYRDTDVSPMEIIRLSLLMDGMLNYYERSHFNRGE